MPIDLQELHASGAEVTGEHADAWLRLRGAKSAEFATLHGGIVGAVRAAHAKLNRRIIPADLKHLDEHPPTDQLTRPAALQPKPETTPMPDALLAELDKVLAERPRGAATALVATLGINISSIKYWRTCGKIPDIRRDAVRAWIDAPTITAIRVEKTRPAAKPIPKLRVVQTTDAPPPIRSAIDLATVMQALGLTVTTAWLPDGDAMRQVRVAVLP